MTKHFDKLKFVGLSLVSSVRQHIGHAIVIRIGHQPVNIQQSLSLLVFFVRDVTRMRMAAFYLSGSVKRKRLAALYVFLVLAFIHLKSFRFYLPIADWRGPQHCANNRNPNNKQLAKCNMRDSCRLPTASCLLRCLLAASLWQRFRFCHRRFGSSGGAVPFCRRCFGSCRRGLVLRVSCAAWGEDDKHLVPFHSRPPLPRQRQQIPLEFSRMRAQLAVGHLTPTKQMVAFTCRLR